MTDEHDPLADLGSLLAAVEPRPTFAAEVRARIADEPHPRAIPWPWTAAVAALAAAVVMAVATHRVAPGASQPRVVAAVPPKVTPAPSVRAAEPAQEAAPRPADASRSHDVVEGPARQFMLDGHQAVVPDDQRVALIRLLAGVRSGRTTVPGIAVPVYDASGLLVPLEPIVIAPLPDLVSADGEDKSGGGPGSGPGKD